MEIKIPYKPRTQFVPFHDAKQRWAVLVCHRRMGKTVACVNHLIRDCIRNPGTYAYIGPTYVQTERIAWKYFHHYTEKIPGMKLNEAKLSATFPTGSTCYLLGSERPDSLRGLGLKGAILDEYQLQPPEVFSEIIAPCLADNSGYAVFAGTIRGKNQLYKLYEKHKSDPEWFSIWVRASESGVLPQAELEVQRKLMSEDEYQQEYELEPTAAIKGAVFGAEMRWLRENKRVCEVPLDPYCPVRTYFDLGMADYTAILFVQSVGLEERIVDAYQTNNTSLSDVAKVLRDKGYRYETHFLPHDARQRSLETGRTTEEYLRTVLSGDIQIIDRPRKKEDAIQAFKLQHKKLWVNQHCESLIDALEQYQYDYDDKQQVFLPLPKHNWCSHFADAATYWAIHQTRLVRPSAQAYDSNISQSEDDIIY